MDWRILQDVVEGELKGGVAIFHPHQRHVPLVSAEWRGHCRAVLRLFRQFHLVVAMLQIQHAKHAFLHLGLAKCR